MKNHPFKTEAFILIDLVKPKKRKKKSTPARKLISSFIKLE